MSSDHVQVPLSRAMAEQRIRALALDPWNIELTQHAFEASTDPDDEVTSDQVYEVIREGDVTRDPIWNDVHENWECRMEKTVFGDRVVVIVALESDLISVITTFTEE